MSSRGRTANVEDYPSVLWITVPTVLLISAYFVRKWYLARKLRLYGIGKGAPGFQTGVKRIRVTPEIAARIRRGEEVSPEEIARAAAEAELSEARRVPDETPVPRDEKESEAKSEAVNEWLPENITTPKKKAKGKRR